jgi:hypothetical protein
METSFATFCLPVAIRIPQEQPAVEKIVRDSFREGICTEFLSGNQRARARPGFGAEFGGDKTKTGRDARPRVTSKSGRKTCAAKLPPDEAGLD